MKNIKDLKEELLSNNIGNFYVFYGEDYGLKKHYIDFISKKFGKIRTANSYSDIESLTRSSGLFVRKNIYLIYDDEEFASLKVTEIEAFISKLGENCLILVYEEPLESSNLFKSFDKYITNFKRVEDNIAQEFVDMEVKLSQQSKADLCNNCDNDYNKILLECDKIKRYSEEQNVSNQSAYDDLYNQNQLLYKNPKYNADLLMDDVIMCRYENLAFWAKIIKEQYYNEFWMSLNTILNNYIIAYLIKQYGKWEGSSKCYQYGLPWGRTKVIRDYIIGLPAIYFLDSAYEVSKLDYKMKSGIIQVENLFDYFLSTII